MTAFVTGATGFIGSHLVDKLVADGESVLASYRSQPGSAPAAWVRVDDLSKTRPDLAGVDVVFHLAGRAHQVGADTEAEAAVAHTVNVEGTRSVVTAAAEAGVRRVVFVSTVAVYGPDPVGPIDEHAQPSPASAYGRTKLEAEHVVAEVLGGTSTDWVIVRPALVYGAGNPGNMARLLGLVRRGLPLPFGSIRNKRSFIHVDDLVDAMVTMASHPAASRQVFTAAGGDPVSTAGLVTAIATVTGRRARLVRVPVGALKALGRVGDFGSRVLRRTLPFDSYSVDRLTGSFEVKADKLRDVLGWTPQVTLEDGLRRTLRAPP